MTRILINITTLVFIFITIAVSQKDNEKNYKSINPTSIIDSTQKISLDTINIYPRDDNSDTLIPKRNRIWWYSEQKNLPTDKQTVINIKGDGWRGGKYVTPVYSYDNEIWHRFQDSEIVDYKGADALWNYSLIKKFDFPSVIIARTFPYFPNRVEKLISKYRNYIYFKREIIGRTPMNYPLYLFTITDYSVPENKKKRIWIQARTHSGETQSSFVLEGLINYLLSPENLNNKVIDLKKVIFNIVPIVNVDGIAVGNSRYNAKGQDLERQWLKQIVNPYLLEDSVAQEVKLIHDAMVKLSKTPAEFILALNIHGKNAFIGESPFLYTNFKKPLKEHGPGGDTLYKNQLLLAKCISDFKWGDTITVQMGYAALQPMEEKPFPESWWWINFHSEVTAVTIEVTESTKNMSNRRIDIDGYIDFGGVIAKGLFKFYQLYEIQKTDSLNQKLIPIEELEKFYKKNPWE